MTLSAATAWIAFHDYYLDAVHLRLDGDRLSPPLSTLQEQRHARGLSSAVINFAGKSECETGENSSRRDWSWRLMTGEHRSAVRCGPASG